MQPNPMLMTVVANPNPCHSAYQPNPYVLIDSATNKIIRTWRGSMTDRKPWDWATDAARRLGRPVFVVAHPYVPSTFRAGVEVSPLFYFGGPFQEVHPDGSTSPGPAGGYKRNPRGFLPSMAGGIAGTIIANALSNPPRTRAGAEKALDKAIEQAWYRHASGLQVSVMDIPKIFRDVKLEIAAGTDIDSAVVAVANRYRAGGSFARNPSAAAAWERMTRRQRRATLEFAGVDEDSAYYLSGSSWGALDPGSQRKIMAGWLDSSRTSRRMRETGGTTRIRRHETTVRMTRSNPPKKASYVISCDDKGYKMNGRRRKVTMSLEKFAKYLKSKGDPKIWNDFIKKIKGYQKWTHGSLPKTVTVEVIDKPGVSGIWLTYDAGRVPESAYVMPKGSKRKGAWKHPWETAMPRIKHDPEAGIVMHKLAGQNKISDFYHR